MSRPVIGVSACLLGHRVRYNGADRAHSWIVESLAAEAELIPFCPEMEMGLGSPRESLRLVREERGGAIRLKTVYSQKDLTELAEMHRERLISRLLKTDGLILKRASPSCAIEKVKVYNADGIPGPISPGFFGGALRKEFPDTPMIEEGRLSDPVQREEFVTRVFSFHRLRQLPAQVREIQAFHRAHKLLLMAHEPSRYSELGRVAANSDNVPPEEALMRYRKGFLDILGIPSSTRKKANVLQHVLGYFKKELGSAEKAHLLGLIDEYREARLPLIAVTSVMEHLLTRFSLPYLDGQLFFEPFPRRLIRSAS